MTDVDQYHRKMQQLRAEHDAATAPVVVCPLCGYDLIRDDDGTWRHQRAVVCPPPSSEQAKPEEAPPATLTTGDLLDAIGWTDTASNGSTWLKRRLALVGRDHTPGSGNYRQWTPTDVDYFARLLDLEELIPDRLALCARLSTGRAWRRTNGRTTITITLEHHATID